MTHLLLTSTSVALLLLYFGAPLSFTIPIGAVAWLAARFYQIKQPILEKCLLALIVLYPTYICIIQSSYWLAGLQGIDFGIFSQIIFQVAERGLFQTSLISTEWQNFITHHFSPFLLIAGLIARLGIPPEVVLIGIHTISVALLIWGLFALHRISGSSLHAAILTAVTMMLPGVRRGLGWETHDEVLALPLLVWSLVAHLHGRDSLKLWLLLATFAFKESFGLVVFTIALAYAFDHRSPTNTPGLSSRRNCILTALAGLLFFILVTKILPYRLWYPTFDPTSRIATFAELFNPALIWAKLRWSWTAFIPAVPFLFLHTRETLRRTMILITPAAFSLAAIGITNFALMFDPVNYYTITPALIIFTAVAAPVIHAPKFTLAIFSSLLLAVSNGPRIRSLRIVADGQRGPSAYQELRSVIPQDASVVVGDYTASVLATNSYVQRTFHARKSRLNFDFIVTNRSDEVVPESLQKKSVPCLETPRYLIRCGSKTQRALKDSTSSVSDD